MVKKQQKSGENLVKVAEKGKTGKIQKGEKMVKNKRENNWIILRKKMRKTWFENGGKKEKWGEREEVKKWNKKVKVLWENEEEKEKEN